MELLGLLVLAPQQPRHLLHIAHALAARAAEQLADLRLLALAIAINAAIALLQRRQCPGPAY